MNFVTILLIGFLDYVGISLVYPLFSAMLFDLDYPLLPSNASSTYRGAILGLLIGLTPFVQFFSAPLLGAISDLKGRKKTLLYGIAVGLIAYCLAVVGVWAHSLALLILYRILVGICSGTVPVAQAMIADFSSPQDKAWRFSLFSASLGLGFTVGPFLGGKLGDPEMGDWCGYATPFIAACFMCLASLAVVIFKLEETGQTKEGISFHFLDSLRNVQKVFQWPELKWLFLATFAFAFGWSFFNEFIPVLLREKFHYSLSDIGNYYAYGGAWYALASGVIASQILKQVSPEKIGTKALIGCMIGMLLFLIVKEGQAIWWIVPFLMFSLSFTYPTTGAMVSNRAGKKNQGEMLGIYQSVTGCAMGLSPLMAGAVIGAYPEFASIGGAFAMLLAAAAFWRGIKLAPSIQIQEG